MQHPVVAVSFHSKLVFVAAFAFHYGIFGYILRRVCCRFSVVVFALLLLLMPFWLWLWRFCWLLILTQCQHRHLPRLKLSRCPVEATVLFTCLIVWARGVSAMLYWQDDAPSCSALCAQSPLKFIFKLHLSICTNIFYIVQNNSLFECAPLRRCQSCFALYFFMLAAAAFAGFGLSLINLWNFCSFNFLVLEYYFDSPLLSSVANFAQVELDM